MGWETGRVSSPAFMDMNLQAVRGDSKPKVVLYQFDQDNAMNPHGLLIAYAEATVKPVWTLSRAKPAPLAFLPFLRWFPTSTPSRRAERS